MFSICSSPIFLTSVDIQADKKTCFRYKKLYERKNLRWLKRDGGVVGGLFFFIDAKCLWSICDKSIRYYFQAFSLFLLFWFLI